MFVCVSACAHARMCVRDVLDKVLLNLTFRTSKKETNGTYSSRSY